GNGTRVPDVKQQPLTITSSGAWQVALAGFMRIERFFLGDPGAPAGPAAPVGPAGPAGAGTTLSPLPAVRTAKHALGGSAAAHATIAIATRIICSPLHSRLARDVAFSL